MWTHVFRDHPIEALQKDPVGDYRVIALPANHDSAVDPLLYAIENEVQCIFYGTDSAELPGSTWQAFHHYNLRFDIVVLDHTYGPEEKTSDHLSAHGLIQHMKRIREELVLKETGRVFATHISHEGNPAHPELVDFAAKHGYKVAYDGLVVRI